MSTDKCIWKYPLLAADEQSVSMPKDSEILCVQMQAGRVCLWALVDPLKALEERMIVVFGTGHPVPEAHHPRKYIGTVQMNNGLLVRHVFEIA